MQAGLIIGESDGGNHSFLRMRRSKVMVMSDICKETGAELVNLSKLPSRNIEDTIQGKKVKVQVPYLLVDEIDCFISVFRSQSSRDDYGHVKHEEPVGLLS